MPSKNEGNRECFALGRGYPLILKRMPFYPQIPSEKMPIERVLLPAQGHFTLHLSLRVGLFTGQEGPFYLALEISFSIGVGPFYWAICLCEGANYPYPGSNLLGVGSLWRGPQGLLLLGRIGLRGQYLPNAIGLGGLPRKEKLT